ncbi:histidyl-trna synthetase [Cystoisospora suis]|uniref:Histidine--tRNA ligase, cytoplasmic n=1 Tax=Cystoisospora suis TaxID=483139 RepID=A0A2C6L6U9_9APIC|nr:histidyl-trna synthetase [Cystoisospora suis]
MHTPAAIFRRLRRRPLRHIAVASAFVLPFQRAAAVSSWTKEATSVFFHDWKFFLTGSGAFLSLPKSAAGQEGAAFSCPTSAGHVYFCLSRFESSRSYLSATMASPPPSLGSRPLTLDEWSSYTFGTADCAIDPALISKLEREFSRRFAQRNDTGDLMFSSLSLPRTTCEVPLLSVPAVRATGVLRVVSLLNNASGVRPGLLNSLCSLLNAFSSPLYSLPCHPLPASAAAPAPFATYPSAQQYMLVSAYDDLKKNTHVDAEGGPTNASQVPALQVDEAAVFCGGNTEVAGRLFVSSRLLSTLVTLHDCNAALLTEALMLPLDYFVHQQKRLPPLKGIETSATNISVLLHDSKLPSSDRKSVAAAVQLFPSLPLLLPALGNLREAIKSLNIYLNAELKSATERPVSSTELSAATTALVSPVGGKDGAALDSTVSLAIEERAELLSSTPPPSSPCAMHRPSATAVKQAIDTLLVCLIDLLRGLVSVCGEAAQTSAASFSGASWPPPMETEADGKEDNSSTFDAPSPPESNIFLGLKCGARRNEFIKDIESSLTQQQQQSHLSVEDSPMALVSEVEQRLVTLQELTALQTSLLLQLTEIADVRAFLDAVAKTEKKSKGKKKPAGCRYGMSQGTRRYQQYLVNLIRTALSTWKGEDAVSTVREVVHHHSEDTCLDALRVFILLGGPGDSRARLLADQAGIVSFSSNTHQAVLPNQDAQLEVLLTPVNQIRRIPKAPKGTQDFSPAQMAVRELVLGSVRDIFRRHGGVEIDTPVFELRETLLGKYGENQKLVYDLKDQGGEQLSLRYDLTVPFARYVASHDIDKIRRFHIGKVYRRDEPQMNRGRFREFFQCDFDIAGPSPPMVADAESVAVLVEALRRLQGMVGRFVVKTNHRVLLDGMMEVCGLPHDKFAAACSAIDKLDKEPWEAVRKELVEVKGVHPDVADRIGTLVQKRGTFLDLSKEIEQERGFAENEKVRIALADMRLFGDYLEAMGVQPHEAVFDLSLARGLDYYTGVIFEAILVGGDGERVGSVGGGGRYDKLVGMFSGRDVPAVGLSVGVERLFRMVEKSLSLGPAITVEDEFDEAVTKKKGSKPQEKNIPPASSVVRESFTDVLVCYVGDDMTKACMRVAGLLWKNDIAAEFFYGAGCKLKKQMDFARQRRIPLLVILGEEELQRSTAKLRQLWYDDEGDCHKRTESTTPDSQGGHSGKEEEIPLEQLPAAIKAYFAKHGTTFDRMKERVL